MNLSDEEKARVMQWFGEKNITSCPTCHVAIAETGLLFSWIVRHAAATQGAVIGGVGNKPTLLVCCNRCNNLSFYAGPTIEEYIPFPEL